MYKLFVNDTSVDITDFSESLTSTGSVSLNVSNSSPEGNSSFKGLSLLKDATKEGVANIKITTEDNKVVLQGDNYFLQNASFSANNGGLYLSAYFVESEAEDKNKKSEDHSEIG